MLHVKTPEEVYQILKTEFHPLQNAERVGLHEALGRILAEDVQAAEYVPGFDRSTVDGFAVRARDTFGCSDALPALLQKTGEVFMGCAPDCTVTPDTCAAIPTGGALPEGADAVQMIEFTEDYGDGTIGICKPVAPGNNVIYRGDDVCPGQVVLEKGSYLYPQDLGALAAMGITEVRVARKLRVGIISTGDELVPVEQKPADGQIRDVNSTLLAAALAAAGVQPVCFGIVRDQRQLLEQALRRAVEQCDMVLISGGSSVGIQDVTCQLIESMGRVFLHGIAMKPGKPTIMGAVDGKPVIGLPGNPVAAHFVTHLFVRPLAVRLMGGRVQDRQVSARLAENLSANHGRAQYTGVYLRQKDGVTYAYPIRSKSGLITTLAGSDGYLTISRDCEGLSAGETVLVTLYAMN